MRKTIAILELIILLLVCCPSLAEFDYSPYLLGKTNWPDELAIWNETDYVISSLVNDESEAGNHLRRLTWYRERHKSRELTLERTRDDGVKCDYIPLARPDGACSVICGYKNALDSSLCIDLFAWSENGLADLISISENAVKKPICGDNWFAFMEESADGPALCVFDSFGRMLQKVALPEHKTGILSRCAVSEGGTRAVTVIIDNDTDWLMNIEQNRIIWKQELQRDCGVVAIDKEGCAFITSRSKDYKDQYRPLYIEYYNPEGSLLWQKTLSGNRVVMDSHDIRIDLSSGCVVLDGIALAHSLQLYRMYRLKMDKQGNMLDMDIRECNYHKSYTLFACAPYNFDLFYGIASGFPAALVPFESLPSSSNPGLRLRDIKTYAETGIYVYYNPDGGRYYHADPNCPSVSDKYRPLSPISYDELNTGSFANLMRCRKCNAPERPAW